MRPTVTYSAIEGPPIGGGYRKSGKHQRELELDRRRGPLELKAAEKRGEDTALRESQNAIKGTLWTRNALRRRRRRRRRKRRRCRRRRKRKRLETTTRRRGRTCSRKICSTCWKLSYRHESRVKE